MNTKEYFNQCKNTPFEIKWQQVKVYDNETIYLSFAQKSVSA